MLVNPFEFSADFNSLTPNLLARTIETVEGNAVCLPWLIGPGGGIVVLLLKSMSSLKQLYTMTMDVHKRFRTGPTCALICFTCQSEAFGDVVPRFNERFLLSLALCEVGFALCFVCEFLLSLGLPCIGRRTEHPSDFQSRPQH